MTNFKYHRISKARKIRYICNIYKNTPFLVFLHGFMSDLEGKKPNAFLKFSKKNKLSFLELEYSRHGKSSGKFTNGNITKWSDETSILINKYIKKNNFTIIGSSMGAWIALKQFQKFKSQINSFLGIGSAPEFLENLMWKKFSNKMKSETIKNGIYHLKHGNYEYPIAHQLIKDGRRNKVLNKRITSKIKVTMVHGQKDEVVPVSYSRKVLKIFQNAKKKLLIIKGGDHSLSEKKWLKRILKELQLII